MPLVKTLRNTILILVLSVFFAVVFVLSDHLLQKRSAAKRMSAGAEAAFEDRAAAYRLEMQRKLQMKEQLESLHLESMDLSSVRDPLQDVAPKEARPTSAFSLDQELHALSTEESRSRFRSARDPEEMVRKSLIQKSQYQTLSERQQKEYIEAFQRNLRAAGYEAIIDNDLVVRKVRRVRKGPGASSAD